MKIIRTKNNPPGQDLRSCFTKMGKAKLCYPSFQDALNASPDREFIKPYECRIFPTKHRYHLGHPSKND